MQERNYAIANLRVLAILIVVIGHSIIIYDPAWYSWSGYQSTYDSTFLVSVKHIINGFQMELFFSISGFCMFYSIRKISGIWEFTIKKIKRLIIPFIFVGLFWQISLRFISSYEGYNNKNIIEIVLSLFTFNECGHLWFLPVLFGLFVTSYILIKSSNYSKYYIPIIAIALYVISPYIPNIFRLSDIAKYLLFFMTGYYFNMFDIFKLSHKWKIVIVIISVFIGGGILISNIDNSFSKVILSLSILNCLYIIVPDISNRTIQFIDKNSFGIYLFHSPVLYIGYRYFSTWPPYIYVPLQLMLCILVSILVIYLLRKIHCSFVLGEYAK